MSVFEKVKSGIQSIYPNRSLAIKLVLAFLAVSLAGIALIGVLASNASAHEFGRFVNTQRPTTLAASLTNYYVSSQWMERCRNNHPEWQFNLRNGSNPAACIGR